MKAMLLAIATISSACAGEFVDLFNGKDFANWGAAGKVEQAGYEVKDGTITWRAKI